MIPNQPLDRVVPFTAQQLRARAKEVHDRGMHTAAQMMQDAAALLDQMLAVHKGLVEREEKLTEEVVRLRP